MNKKLNYTELSNCHKDKHINNTAYVSLPAPEVESTVTSSNSSSLERHSGLHRSIMLHLRLLIDRPIFPSWLLRSAGHLQSRRTSALHARKQQERSHARASQRARHQLLIKSAHADSVV